MSRQIKRPEDFTKFYFRQVANGEGCGCAEKVIDVHEFNRLAGTARLKRRWWPQKGAWQRFLYKAGLYSRD